MQYNFQIVKNINEKSEAKLKPARTRIAPSPTGDPHVGTAYQALFCSALAHQTSGQFILRLEDTDKGRYSVDSDIRIFAAIKWCGLVYDEGPDVGGPYAPYRQSERLPIYKDHAEKLIEMGHAYYCFCSPDRLERMRKEQMDRHESPHYDRRCLRLDPSEVAAKICANESHVIRLRVPDAGRTTFHDIVHGDVSFENSLIDDQVLLKSDGFPTYHLAVVVDDHLMKITHIIRGDEWLSSTPKHVLLYQFFGWELPIFIHTPLLLNADRTKISKRKSPEKTSLEGFRKEGYLPEALLNYLAVLGWSHPEEKEIFNMVEFFELFSLENINKSGSFFDLAKLLWMNGIYIRNLPLEDLAERLMPYSKYPYDMILRVLPLLQQRFKLLGEFDTLASFFFETPEFYDLALFTSKQFNKSEIHDKLVEIGKLLAHLDWPWEHDNWEMSMRRQAEELGFRQLGDLLMLLRVAVTGRKETPPLFETMLLMGRDEVLNRINNAAAFLAK